MKYPKPEIDRKTALNLWISEHSHYAKEQVILNNIGLVGYVLKSLKLNIFDEDLQETGIVGLCRAVNGFDASKGVKFNTYATWAIRNEILMTFRKKRIIPVFSLDEECHLDNDESVSYSDMIPSAERFEELSGLKIDLERFLNRLDDREKKIVFLFLNGMSQMKIAKEIGLSQPYISKFLKGIRRKIDG